MKTNIRTLKYNLFTVLKLDQKLVYIWTTF